MMTRLLYKFQFTWYNALARCGSMNMSLVTIDSKNKLDDITALVNTSFSQGAHLWLGGCVNAIDPLEYVWVATGKKFEFNNWAPNQPDFSNSSEYCAHMRASTMLWNDILCTYQMGFMCEYSQQVHKCVEEPKVVTRAESKRTEELDKLNARIVFRDIIFNLKFNFFNFKKTIK